MKLARLLGVLLIALSVGCSAAPVPTAPPSPPTAGPAFTPIPVPSSTLPATWTAVPPSSPQPSSTQLPVATATATTTPPPGRWPVGEIPSVTMTPTPDDSGSLVARRSLEAAQRAYEGGDLDRALELLDEALPLAPEHAGLLTLRGQVLVSQEHPLQGEAALREALGLDPLYAPARRALAELYRAYGRWRDAGAEYTRYLTLAPADPDGWYALGLIRENQGEPIGAIAAYSRTLELDSVHQEGLTRRGELSVEAGRYAAALPDYTSLIDLDPGIELYQARGEIHLELGAPLLAAADFRQVISLTVLTETPAYTLVLQLGSAYLTAGAAQQAAAVFSEAISLTTTLEPRLMLGESLMAAGNYTASLWVYSETLPLATSLEAAQVLIGRGRAHMGMGDKLGAEVDLAAALDFATTASEMAAVLGWRSEAYAAVGQLEDAIADLTAAYQLIPDVVLLYRRAILYEEAGEADAAIADLTAFVEGVDLEKVDAPTLGDAHTRLERLRAEVP